MFGACFAILLPYLGGSHIKTVHNAVLSYSPLNSKHGLPPNQKPVDYPGKRGTCVCKPLTAKIGGFPNNVLRGRLNSGHAALMLPCTVCLAHVVIELEKACVHMSLGLEKACVHTFWGLQRASCPQESGSHPADCPHSRRVDMGI